VSDEDLRLAVYGALAATGTVPTDGRLADKLGIDETAVRDGLLRLATQRHLVVDADGRPVLAHPFATEPFGFSVMGERTLWWGGCAWDSFAIPHLVDAEPSVLVATRCPSCDTALSWVVDRTGPPEGDEVAHFLVPMAQVWDDVVRACSNQRLYCSLDCVERCLSDTAQQRGYVMDLATLWRLAQVKPSLKHSFRDHIREFVVDMKCPAAVGVCSANAGLGSGSVYQYFIPDSDKYIFATGRRHKFAAKAYP